MKLRARPVVWAASMFFATTGSSFALNHIDLDAKTVIAGPTPAQLAELLVGSGLSISNVFYTGTDDSGGSFEGGISAGLGIESGIILTSGSVQNAFGPNIDESTGTGNGLPGSPLLDPFTGFGPGSTQDATLLEFDFIPEGNRVEFNYVFASDEYEEFVDSSFNDVFGFFVNGSNQAVVPGTTTPVTINTINPGTNSAFYLSNSPAGSGPFDNEYDGQTVVLTLEAAVNPGVINTMQLGIADTGDDAYDSAAFIEGGTFSSSVDDDTPVGATPLDPFLPGFFGEGGGFGFEVNPFEGLNFFDPVVSVGYDYILNSGPNFASVVLPSLSFDDNLYDLYLWDGLDWVFEQTLSAGIEHIFAAGGEDRFRILGIDVDNMLDPDDPLAFVTGLSFTDNTTVNFEMIPITAETQPVPEPGSLVLLGSGLVGMVGYRWNRRKKAA